MPILNWIGKEKIVNHDKEVPFRLLRKNKKYSLGKSKNLILEGDNLEALKALMPFYYGKIKCIYIDPPYNTGKEKWVYNDRVNSPKIKEWFKKTVGPEGEDLCRHDKWLCMMYPRLKLLCDLLKDDGVIFVSIDDNEQTNLKYLMDEIFGPENFVLLGVVNRPSEIASNFAISKHEYYAIYTKNINLFSLSGKARYTVSRGTVGNKDQTMPVITFPKGLRCIGVSDGIYHKTRKINKGSENIENLGPIIVKNGKLYKEVRLKARWRSSNDMRKFFGNKCKPIVAKINGIIEEIYLEGDRFMPQIKKKIIEKIPSLILDNKRGSKDMELVGFSQKFDFPKSVDYIEKLISFVTSGEDIVLDSFAGSGTTGHAVLDLNKDGGNRKFILVEMEKNIAKNITAERVKRVVKGYSYKTSKGKAMKVLGLGGGFEYVELGEPLFDERGMINEKVSYIDMARYVFFTETHVNLEKAKIKGNYLGKFNDYHYFLLFDGIGKNVLDRKFLKEIKQIKGDKIIYADKCLLDEEILEKHNIIFKQIPYEVKIY